MPSSTRFAAATHLMVLLACERDRPQTSELLANSLSTNPAVVRRLLGALTKAGLTSSQLGKGGGSMLARGPKKITLADIYRAVETPGLVAMPRATPNPSCPVSGAVGPVLDQVGHVAEAAFMAALEAVSLKQVAKEIAAQNAAANSAA